MSPAQGCEAGGLALTEQDPYAREFRRKAEVFRALARLAEPHAEAERSRVLVEVALGLAEVCEMLAEAQMEPDEVPEEDE